jgi:hypothetical protein
MVSGFWVGVPRLDLALKKFAAESELAAKETVTKTAAAAVRYAHANFGGSHAKGLPHTDGDQPDVVTGYLRRSITMSPAIRTGSGMWETTASVNAVYGRRVELGFHDVDSLGRAYNQRGYPYFGPAVHQAMGEMAAIASMAFRSHLNKLTL